MTKKTQPKSGSEIFVPLNMLKKSPRNVRKVEHTAAEIEGLAASIAANMLQNLVVEPERDGEGHDTTDRASPSGRRRSGHPSCGRTGSQH
jgi:ParB family chromosome partitioning protein